MSGVIGVAAPGHPGYRSGAYYCAHGHTAGNGSAAVAADLIYFYPIIIRKAVVMDGLAVRVGTAVSASVKLAIYDNSGGVAGTKSLISASALVGDMNETAGNTISLDLPAPLSLIPGFYWGAALFSGAAQPYTNNGSGAVAMSGLGDIMGAANAAVFTAAAAPIRITLSNTYASGFPDVAAAPTVAASNVIPIIAWYAF